MAVNVRLKIPFFKVYWFLRVAMCVAVLSGIACESKTEKPMTLRTVAPVPAHPGISESGRQLLQRLSGFYGKATLAGQVDYLENNRWSTLDYLKKETNRSPVIVGFDLIDYSLSRRAHGADPGNIVEEAIALAKKHGHVITLSWTWNAPMHLLNDDREPWSRGYYATASEFNLRSALRNPKSAEYLALLADIDAIAEVLRQFQQQDIPVLWRPLHQPEGRWFWWGARGPEAFKELWRLMFVRMTGHHGLNNLLWVLTSEDADWYPGDDVVDIVGLDAYPNDTFDDLGEQWGALLKQHNGRKMIALTEFGWVPNVDDMQLKGIWFSYFVSWTDQNRGKLGPKNVSREYLRSVYHNSGVVTLASWQGRVPEEWQEPISNDDQASEPVSAPAVTESDVLDDIQYFEDETDSTSVKSPVEPTL